MADDAKREIIRAAALDLRKHLATVMEPDIQQLCEQLVVMLDAVNESAAKCCDEAARALREQGNPLAAGGAEMCASLIRETSASAFFLEKK